MSVPISPYLFYTCHVPTLESLGSFMSSYSFFPLIPNIPVIPKSLHPPPPPFAAVTGSICTFICPWSRYMHWHTVSLQTCVCVFVCVCSLFQQRQSGSLDLKCLVFTPLSLSVGGKWNTNFLSLSPSLSLSLALYVSRKAGGLLNWSLPGLSLTQCTYLKECM